MATAAPASDHRSVSGGLARAAVFGINDGLISNVSLVIGFAGSGVSADVVRLAGFAGAIAGAASMAAGEWVSVTAQNDLVRRELELEKREIAVNTKKETQELAAYYRSHGMSAEQAMRSALEVMQDPEVALLVHAREEFGLDPTDLPSPVKVACLSFICFIFGALLPVVPWMGGTGGNLQKVLSVLIGMGAAAVVGGLVGKFAERRIVWTAVRQVLILLLACGATYLVGKMLGVSIS
jgi:VIT1/CCC1 family predicted Fe2+/Mn2+ transporter